MKIIESEQILCVDIDDTLIMWDKNSVHEDTPTIAIKDPYEDSLIHVYPHEAHIKLVKDKKARGSKIIVWSQSGYKWAEAVIKAVGLESHVDMVMTKPSAYIDDLPCQEWLSPRIYLSPKSNYKVR